MSSKNDFKSTSGSPIVGPERMLEEGNNLPEARVTSLGARVGLVRPTCKALRFRVKVHVGQHVIMPSLNGWELRNNKRWD